MRITVTLSQELIIQAAFQTIGKNIVWIAQVTQTVADDIPLVGVRGFRTIVLRVGKHIKYPVTVSVAGCDGDSSQ